MRACRLPIFPFGLRYFALYHLPSSWVCREHWYRISRLHCILLYADIAKDDILIMTAIVVRLDYVVIEIFGLLPA